MLEKATTMEWGTKPVRYALADAYRVLYASAGRVGHKPVKAAWPSYQLEPADIAEQRLAGNIHHGRMKAIIKPSALDITRMEIVLLGTAVMPAWLNGAVTAYPDHRYVLIAAVEGQAKRYSGRDVAQWLGMPEATFRLHRDFAASIIAIQLNRTGIRVW